MDQLPEDFFEDPVTSEVARRIKEHAPESPFSSSVLMDELEDTAAADLLLRVIGRVGDVSEDPLAEYEGVWARLQRDIWRTRRQRRAETLRASMAEEASRRGRTGRWQDLQKEYFDILKELKRGGA